MYPHNGILFSNRQVSHIAVDSLPAEPQGKPKNAGVGSLSLLQWIFLTQESSQGGLLHCRRILHQLNYEGNPNLAGGVLVASSE